jgi:HEAT repeat protein
MCGMTSSDDLITRLQSGTPEQKDQALQDLDRWGDAAIEPLIQSVLEADNQDIEGTLQGFDWEEGQGQSSDPPFKLIDAMKEYDAWYIPAASLHLIQAGRSAMPSLLALLENARPVVRAWAAYVLGRIGDERAIEPLLMRLKTEDTDELIQAIAALGKLGAHEAVDQLILFLEHDDATGVPAAAAMALGTIGATRAITPLITHLKQHKHSVYAMSAALGHFGKQAVLPLLEVLADPTAVRVYDLVLIGLSRLDDQRVIEPVLHLLKQTVPGVKAARPPMTPLRPGSEDLTIAYWCMITLGNLKAAQALTTIAEVLFATADMNMTSTAAQAIAQIGTQEAVDVLVAAIGQERPEVQHAAVLALSKVAPVHALPVLLNVVTSADRSLRQAAVVSLGNFGGSRRP